MSWRITTLAMATTLGLFAGVPVAGQELTQPPPGRTAAGMVYDGNQWRNPTIAEALRLLGMEREEAWTLVYTHDVSRPAIAILRQTLETRPEAELDEFANKIADLMVANTTWTLWSNAERSLIAATRADYSHYGGTPHRGSFDALVRVYEEAPTYGNLLAVRHADPQGRGRDYVLGVQRGSSKPPLCLPPESRDDEPWPRFCEDNSPSSTTWCRAGSVLYQDSVYAAIERQYGQVATTTSRNTPPLPIDGLSEPAAEWWSLCWTPTVPCDIVVPIIEPSDGSVVYRRLCPEPKG
ncbi:MAG: hypothetical protein OXQ94_14695 [Gemmatimonadota bacterium]|nr:hypothetical protein [Gemmatimonadota bacterium]MDE2872923.1 hypothetical protein [Gemmatimonadota bacterium]